MVSAKKILGHFSFHFLFSFFVGNAVTPISTLANNKRSCSKKWKLSGQNCVFSVFPAKILSRRSRLLRTTRGSTRLIRPRPIDCDSGCDRQMNSFLGFAHGLVSTSPKQSFFRAHFVVLIYTPKEAHSRIIVTGGSFSARQKVAKNSLSWRDKLVQMVMLIHQLRILR